MKLEQVVVEAKANVYFEGKVNSRNVYLPSGDRITLGFMQKGEYTFGTGDKEIMKLLGGDMRVLLPNENDWKDIKVGETFEVPANSSFNVEIKEYADYYCEYIK